MIKLSVVIITYNEERNIERCLESVKDIADDIVVVDSFSTDRTEEICSGYNVRFVKHEFEGHIEQKNRAITQAEYPHILSLDADEALSDELKMSINAVKDIWQYDGYYFNRLTNYCGKWIHHTGWYPDRKLRLWDSRKGKWKGVNPHDKYILEPGSKQCYLKGDILHYSFYTIAQHLQQINKFSEISAIERYKRRKKTTLINLILNPAWKFIHSYFIKLGMLDGYYGLIISINSAYSTYLKHIKLKKLYTNGKSQKPVI